MKGVSNKSYRKLRLILAGVSVVLLVGFAVGVYFCWQGLKSTWQAQCVIDDISFCVTVNEGRMVKGDAVLVAFGLTNGANLAQIDFPACRKRLLARAPSIRDITISRRMPNCVDIDVVERTPVVRMNLVGAQRDTGRVADTEGVVFECRRGTSMLPVIRETVKSFTPIGQRLKGYSLAALRLIEAAGAPELSSLGVVEVDVAHRDYVLMTFGEYATAKIAWEGMKEPNEANRKNMLRVMTQLNQAVHTEAGVGVRIWDATVPDYIYADTKGVVP